MRDNRRLQSYHRFSRSEGGLNLLRDLYVFSEPLVLGINHDIGYITRVISHGDESRDATRQATQE